MGKSKFLGELEIVVIAALMRLGNDSYGVAIVEEVESQTGRVVSIGALYATLARLETKGYVTSQLGEATPQRGGRAKRYYQTTADGISQLTRSATMLSGLLSGLPGWQG